MLGLNCRMLCVMINKALERVPGKLHHSNRERNWAWLTFFFLVATIKELEVEAEDDPLVVSFLLPELLGHAG